MRTLSGRVAVVTGAASGIGLAIAEELIRHRCSVVLSDIRQEPLDRAVASLSDAGGDVFGVCTDVGMEDDVVALHDTAMRRHGAIHVLCNNAGITVAGTSIAETTSADWQWIWEVNVMSVVHGVRYFMPTLLAQAEAHIVNTASLAAFSGAPFNGPYSASKAAVLSISESLYRELRIQGARVGVSVLCPGAVRTAFAESESRRPARHKSEPRNVNEAMMTHLERSRASGIAATDVGELVVDAITNDRFYVLTHRSEALLRSRGEQAAAGEPPDVRPLMT